MQLRSEARDASIPDPSWAPLGVRQCIPDFIPAIYSNDNPSDDSDVSESTGNCICITSGTSAAAKEGARRLEQFVVDALIWQTSACLKGFGLVAGGTRLHCGGAGALKLQYIPLIH